MLKLLSMPATVTVTIPLLPGVVIECRPPTTALIEQARFNVRGSASDDGAREEAYTLALLKAAVISWAGVGDESGQPVPVSDETLTAFARLHPVGTLWRSEYLSAMILRALEGEGCAPVPSGTSAGARDTAPGAGTSLAHGGNP
nr:uncharacterized protein [uncultured bacterium]